MTENTVNPTDPKWNIHVNGLKRWDNYMQDDIYEIVIGPFKTQEESVEYTKRMKLISDE